LPVSAGDAPVSPPLATPVADAPRLNVARRMRLERLDPLLGRGMSAIPYNFVREIQVRTGGYEAEFGRSLGGIVDVLTHSGSNEFRAETFGFFTNNRFSGERRIGILERAVTRYSYYDAGASVSGPIRRGRS
jgi:hypothetical protein